MFVFWPVIKLVMVLTVKVKVFLPIEVSETIFLIFCLRATFFHQYNILKSSENHVNRVPQIPMHLFISNILLQKLQRKLQLGHQIRLHFCWTFHRNRLCKFNTDPLLSELGQFLIYTNVPRRTT